MTWYNSLFTPYVEHSLSLPLKLWIWEPNCSLGCHRTRTPAHTHAFTWLDGCAVASVDTHARTLLALVERDSYVFLFRKWKALEKEENVMLTIGFAFSPNAKYNFLLYVTHSHTCYRIKNTFLFLRKYQKWLPMFTRTKPKGKKNKNLIAFTLLVLPHLTLIPTRLQREEFFSKRVLSIHEYVQIPNGAPRIPSHVVGVRFGLCRFNSAQLWVNLIMIKIFFSKQKKKEKKRGVLHRLDSLHTSLVSIQLDVRHY